MYKLVKCFCVLFLVIFTVRVGWAANHAGVALTEADAKELSDIIISLLHDGGLREIYEYMGSNYRSKNTEEDLVHYLEDQLTIYEMPNRYVYKLSQKNSITTPSILDVPAYDSWYKVGSWGDGPGELYFFVTSISEEGTAVGDRLSFATFPFGAPDYMQ